jgi:hypothetical protein
MFAPFTLQTFPHWPFSFRKNDVNLAWVRLQKAVNAVDSLHKVVKLMINAYKNGAMAKALEIAA